MIYCPKCGKALDDSAFVCSDCGYRIKENFNNKSNYAAPIKKPVTSAVSEKSKSKVLAGLLAIFLGFLGIHNFYLGYVTKGIIQLVISLLGIFFYGSGTIFMFIWAVVEAVLIFTGKKKKDAKGNLLV